ncbi:hypothetical protein GS539_19320 [Rhodococcus hoagii]|nr:hypothetical protein [Prescottella equi]
MSDTAISTITRTVEYTIDGADPMTMSYGHQQFTPRRLIVTVSGAPGVTPGLLDCTAYGPRRLKSGKDGQEERDRNLRNGYVNDGGKWVYRIDPNAPQWVTDCVNQTIGDFQ